MSKDEESRPAYLDVVEHGDALFAELGHVHRARGNDLVFDGLRPQKIDNDSVDDMVQPSALLRRRVLAALEKGWAWSRHACASDETIFIIVARRSHRPTYDGLGQLRRLLLVYSMRPFEVLCILQLA
jgi:hypothetical protein